MGWTKLVSTEMDDETKLDMFGGGLIHPEIPDFPGGMKIQMDEWLLDRLELGQDVEVGDLLDMRAFAVVTSVRKEQANGKSTCCVCLTIEKISIEDEMTESTEPDEDDD